MNGKGINDHWLYEAAVYGNDQVREFSNFDGGAIMFGKIGYDYSAESHLDSAIATFRYMHNTAPGFKSAEIDSNYSAPTSPSFGDSIALTNDIIQGRFGLTTDLLYGFGFEGKADQAGASKLVKQSDVFGINIIPSYFIADGLQLVTRFQFATSDDNNGFKGIPLQGRYEQYSPTFKGKIDTKRTGDTYASVYAGLNYYLYGHKLKIMNGVEYSHLGGGDYDGYTFLSGLRMSF